MNTTLKKQITKSFTQTVQDLKEINEIELFLKDLMGEAEFEKYVKKLAIAYWIKKGRDNKNIINNLDVTQKEINEAKKIITTPGIKLALKYLEAEEWANVWAEKIKKVIK